MFLHTRRAHTIHSLALVLVIGLFWGQPATAVNCDKNPSHSQCNGGGGDPPNEEDPCLGSTSRFPAFTFLQDTSPLAGSPYKLVASSADGVCQRVLLDETQGAGNTDFVFMEGESKGRVLWDNGGSKVFLLDFDVAGNNVLSVSEPVQVLDTNTDPDNPLSSGWGWGYGMSRDGHKLAYSWSPDNNTETHSLHIVDLVNCIALSCVHDPENTPVVLFQEASTLDGPDGLDGDHIQWREVGWDNSGEKIILIQNLQFDDGTRHVLSVRFVYLDFSLENPYVSDITPLNKFTLSDPDFGPYKAASGWSEIPGQSSTGEREKLAIKLEHEQGRADDDRTKTRTFAWGETSHRGCERHRTEPGVTKRGNS